MKIDDLFEDKPRNFYRELSKLKMPPTKAMLQEIESKDLGSGHTDYISFFREWKGKIVEQTFAFCHKYKKLHIQEVMRRVEGCSNILVRNMYFTMMAGYKTVWDWTHASSYYWYACDKDQWFIGMRKNYNVARWYSKSCGDFISKKYPNLKYNSYDVQASIISYIDWLTIYKTFPEIEILAKIGMPDFAKSTKFLQKLQTDKKFCKWIIKYREDIINNQRYIFGQSATVISAYNKGLAPLEYLKYRDIDILFKHVPQLKAINKDRMYKYLEDTKIDYTVYQDYANAILYLGLDILDTKNTFPKNFRAWHDQYTKLYSIAKCNKDNEEIDSQMKSVHDKYLKYENYDGNYKIVLPSKTLDLIDEGKALDHCVGRMNYNKKMAKDESLILFVREDANTPLYTMEYNPHKRQIIQFYGKGDSEVDKSIRNEIENWLLHFKLRKKKGVEYLYG